MKIENSKLKIVPKQRGFSLVELLMVIAIIGIISTIILNSVSTSRAKAYDSKVKQQLSSFRTAADMYFSNQSPNGYGPASANCTSGIFNDVSPSNGSPGLYIAAGNLPDFVQLACNSTDSSFIVKASLFSGNEYWCVDNKGASKMVSGAVTNLDAFCP